MQIDISKAHNSTIVRNHANDPSYAPHCLHCDDLRRMRVVEPFLFRHHCGAVHDERQVIVSKGKEAADGHLDKRALLPCPFCGNPDVQLVTLQDADGDTLHAVGCPKCGCNGTPHVAAMDDPRPAAVAAWNRRALLTAPPEVK